MTTPRARRDGFGILGIGAAACVVCCAAPILGVLGGLSIVGLAGTFVVGLAGLAVTIAAAVAVAVVRARRRSCDIDSGPVPVAPPTRKRV